MGTIQAGVGIISGLPIDDIVTQLIAIEARPLKLVENQIARVQAQRTGFLDISARMLALKATISRFDTPGFFRASKATSSNENVLLATAEEGASTGSFSFLVRSLVSSHQLASNRFADRDTTPVGAGRITLEVGNGLLNESTTLDQLNGQLGIRRGEIRITDRSGATVDVDLSTALTMDDVLDAINTQTTAAVRAKVNGDRLELEDFSGGTGLLGVADLGLGQTAADLGIDQQVAAASLTSNDLVYLTDRTGLDLLNDGNGIRTQGKKQDDFQITASDGAVIQVRLDDDLLKLRTGQPTEAVRLDVLNNGHGVRLGTIRITDRAGVWTDVDLSGAVTVADVETAIESAVPNVSVTLDNRSSFLISLTDPTPTTNPDDPPPPNFVIEDVNGFAARDLGIAADVDGNTITGSDIHRISTLGDVMRAINFALDQSGADNAGRVVASLSPDGNGIVLSDNTAGAGTLTVTALNGSGAAEDLGINGLAVGNRIQSRHLIAGLNTVLISSINGGSGSALGTIDIRLSDNTVGAIDLSGAATVAEVINRINGAGFALSAAVNSAGNGIVLRDTSGGTGPLVITDGVGGTAATDLNLLVNANVAEINSGNLQRQYIAENTRLDDLRLGKGIARGRFRITNSLGVTGSVSLAEADDQTLGDALDEINALNIDVTARINDTGDGIVLVDTAGGNLSLKVEEDGSTTAADLNILGQATQGETEIDGTYEIVIDIDADDTLNDVQDKINASAAGVSALIYSIGSVVDPFRLSLTSETTGRRGRILIDAGSVSLSFSTQSEPRDALVSYNGDLISSPTNTLDEFIRGVSIDLIGTDPNPVTVTVSEDIDQVVTDVTGFVDSFNDVMDRIDELTSFDPDNPTQRGILQGDSGIRRIERRLQNAVIFSVETSNPAISRLNSVGIRFRNNRLSFDEAVLREAIASDPDAVVELFTKAEVGFGVRLKEEIDRLTGDDDGLLSQQTDRLENQEKQLNDRAEDLQLLLDAKEARLRAQFIAMERALAGLQAQQSALAGLIALPAATGNLGIGGLS